LRCAVDLAQNLHGPATAAPPQATPPARAGIARDELQTIRQ